MTCARPCLGLWLLSIACSGPRPAPEEVLVARMGCPAQRAEELIVPRVAAAWGESPSDAEVEEAMSGVLSTTGLSIEQLAEELVARGYTLHRYRSELRAELARVRVARRIGGEARLPAWLDDVRRRWARACGSS